MKPKTYPEALARAIAELRRRPRRTLSAGARGVLEAAARRVLKDLLVKG